MGCEALSYHKELKGFHSVSARVSSRQHTPAPKYSRSSTVGFTRSNNSYNLALKEIVGLKFQDYPNVYQLLTLRCAARKSKARSEGPTPTSARAKRNICFCAAARRKRLKWCSKAQLRAGNHRNFENHMLTQVSRCSPCLISQIKIWMHSWEAYMIIWNVFGSLFWFLVPRGRRLKKMMKKHMPTRWESELPEGQYYRNLEESASHHIRFLLHAP